MLRHEPLLGLAYMSLQCPKGPVMPVIGHMPIMWMHRKGGHLLSHDCRCQGGKAGNQLLLCTCEKHKNIPWKTFPVNVSGGGHCCSHKTADWALGVVDLQHGVQQIEMLKTSLRP